MSAWYDLSVAVTRHDIPDFPMPSRQGHMVRFDHPWHGLPEEALLARDGDQLVGVASCLLPQLDNTDMLHLDLRVHPRHRRRGIGTALLHEVYAVARRNDRSLVEVTAITEFPGGPPRDDPANAYLTHRDHKPGLLNVRSRCHIDGTTAVDEATLAEAWQHASGYSLVQWRDRTPDDVIDDIAALESRLSIDAPSGELQVEPEVIDADGVRANDATKLARGSHDYATAARHDATGEIVAQTVISFEEGTDDHAWQFITIVEPSHRGHRLGLIVKAANHAYVLANEPQLREIDTWNAEENTHMRSVNEMLGFRPVDRWPIWQLPVPALDGSA